MHMLIVEFVHCVDNAVKACSRYKQMLPTLHCDLDISVFSLQLTNDIACSVHSQTSGSEHWMLAVLSVVQRLNLLECLTRSLALITASLS